MESFVDERNNLFDELWAKTVGASDWTNQLCQLCARFGYKTFGGIHHI